jgi:hypothetical protein
VSYPRQTHSYPTFPRSDDDGRGKDYLRRIAEAVERIADAVAGPVVKQKPEILPTYPIIDCDDPSPELGVAEPHIQRSAGGFYYAVCTYCPVRPGRAANVREPSTWLEYGDSSVDVDDQRAALARHLAHHRKQADSTAALPIWTWSDHSCPRCHAPAEHKCRTNSGRPSTSVHAERWQDHSDDYW